MVLKNSDIRVGNLVASGTKFDDTTSIIGKVLQIGNDDVDFEQIWCECDESFEWFFKNNYCGIPLTEKFHNKFGIFKNGLNRFEYNISRFDKNDLFLIFSDDYLYLKSNTDDRRSPHEIICLWNKDLKKEFYVHEFQNLYFSITNKELTFKF